MYRNLITVLFCFLVVAVLTGPVCGDDRTDTDAEFLNPSDMHKMLGQQKAEALDRSRRMAAQALVSSAEDQTDYDMIWYDINIRVNDTTEILYGKITFLAAATVDGLGAVEVDLNSGMAVDSIKAASGDLAYGRALDRVTVVLDRTYNTGEEFRFDFYYSGHPVESGLQAFSFGYHLGKRSISSLSEPYFARTWWPCKDRMDDKPDSISAHIEVDSGLYCASNGVLDSITAGGAVNSHVFHYTHRYPIATYLFSVAIAPFVVWQQNYSYDDAEGTGTMPIIHHVYTDWEANSYSTWGQSPTIMAAFEENYGPYPFRSEKYGHANFDWGGGMEHQTLTSMVGSSFGFSTPVIAHEMSHQWWGDLVTCKSWHDIWLNEGWASYSEAVYELERAGWSAYHNYMGYMAYKGSGTVWCDDTVSVYRIFNGNLSYDKGAWVVHMLRRVVGEENFAAGIEAYRTAYAYSAATTSDFQLTWEAATGVDLGAFIAEWVYGQYYPKYQYYFENVPDGGGGYDIYVAVKQTQNTTPNVFDMPVDFYFDYTYLPGDTITLRVDQRKQVFHRTSSSPVSNIELDPDGWILKDASLLSEALWMVTTSDELSEGLKYEYYEDTIRFIGTVTPDDVLVMGGQMPPGLTIGLDGIISGTPTTSGQFTFELGIVNYSSSLSDQGTYQITINNHSTCCVGLVGNANGSDGDEPTIGDITTLIDMLFIGRQPVDCLAEADVNQSGGFDPQVEDITIGDISKLIDHLFLTEPPLPECL